MASNEDDHWNQIVWRFEGLELLRNDCERLAEYARVDDQMGFRQNQEMSASIFQIENDVATPEMMERLVNQFREYNSSWLEHLRKNSSMIRKFSPSIADVLDSMINQLETETRASIREMNDRTNEELLQTREHLISSIKSQAHSFAILFDRCKITISRIKTNLSEISGAL